MRFRGRLAVQGRYAKLSITPMLQVMQRVLPRHLLGRTGLKADEGHGGAVTLIQRFGSAANLNIHLHCLVQDGVYQCRADGTAHPPTRTLDRQGRNAAGAHSAPAPVCRHRPI